MKLIDLFNQTISEIQAQGGLRPAHHFHSLTTDEHMLKVVATAREQFPGWDLLEKAALAHDLGKLPTHEDGTFKKHDPASVEMASQCDDVPQAVLNVVGNHSWIYNVESVKDKSIRKFLRKICEGTDQPDYQLVDLYVALAKCDAEAFSPEGREQRLKDIAIFQEKVAPHLEWECPSCKTIHPHSGWADNFGCQSPNCMH